MGTREELPAGNGNNNNWFKAKLVKIKGDVVDFGKLAKQLAKNDPRRAVHSLKVGLAIAIVSSFYFDPLYEGFGVDAMWAVLTVVVVFEYSVGATLGKSFNRVVATILGGWCAVGTNKLSGGLGPDLLPVLLGLLVFIIASVATFMRFFPKIKARFDYGMVIFILTFSLVCVSGYRNAEVMDIAERRMNTILIGCSIAVATCIAIWPVWAGNDLHKLTASHIEKLGNFLEDFGDEYIKDSTKMSMGSAFKNVIDSKTSVDSLVNFAEWEPRHKHFKYRHPWSQYQKICALTRDCACRLEALHSFLYSQTQASKEVKAKFQELFSKMSSESGKALKERKIHVGHHVNFPLKELSSAITKMTQPSKAHPHVENAKKAAILLNIMLESNIWENVSLLAVTPAATVASILIDVVVCTEKMAEAVQELASLAKFRSIVDTTEVAPENERASQGVSTIITVECSSQSSPRSSVYDEDPPSLALPQHNAD